MRARPRPGKRVWNPAAAAFLGADWTEIPDPATHTYWMRRLMDGDLELEPESPPIEDREVPPADGESNP